MQKKNALKQSSLLGVCFLILFTSNSSFSTIITQLHQQDGNSELGPFLLAFYYSCYMLANIISPSIPWKYKTQMTYAPLLYAANYFTGFILPCCDTMFFKYLITSVGAMMGGFGAAILWTSMGGFLHKLCQKYNVQSSKGKYFGIFSGIFCVQSITGSLITTFGLGYLEKSTYFMIVTLIALFSSVFFKIFIEDLQQNDHEFCQSANEGQKILEKQISQQNLRVIKIQKPSFTLKGSFTKLCNFYPKMVHTLPIIFIDGLAIGFINSSLTHLIPHSQTYKQANFKAGICFSLYGFGSIVGGYASSIFTDYYSLKKTGYMNAYIFLAALFITYFCIGTESYVFVMTVFFLWGLTLYYIEGWMMVICSKKYEGALQSFAINKQVHSFSFVVYEIFIMVNQNKIQMQYLLPFLAIFTIPVFLGLNAMVKADDMTQNQLNYSNKWQENQKKNSLTQIVNSTYMLSNRLIAKNLEGQKLLQNQER